MIEINLNNINKTEKGLREEMRTVRRDGKVFQRKTRVGTKDSGEVGGPTFESLSAKLDDIKNKMDLADRKLDNIENEDIEPDQKERKIKRLMNKQAKLKVEFKSVKSEVDGFKQTKENGHDNAKSKVDRLETQLANHSKLMKELDDIPKIKDIMEPTDTAAQRAVKLKEWKAKFAGIQKKLKASKTKIGAIK